MTQKLHVIEERRKRALLVGFSGGRKNSRSSDAVQVGGDVDAPDEDSGRELKGLAAALDLEIAGYESVSSREKNPKFGVGTGKAAELAEKAKQLEVDCFVFDWDPSPSQQRNWENLAGIPALDRQELIIRIFAARAATREAALQVQLAELTYRLPRLTHKYIDLSRQRGGRYGTRGSGETRLETDRRQIEQRIHRLEKEIEEVAKQRQVQRRQRERQGMPVCAIVGYTNAGKSSLLNTLTGAAVFVEDKLFATLDAATRRFEPAPGMPVLLTDTVGFIRRLPHSLVKAFRSTLEEAAHANLLLHILDVSDPDMEDCFQTTISVLHELGASAIPSIVVLNKIDKLTESLPLTALRERFPDSVAVSAKTGYGLDELKCLIVNNISVTNYKTRQG